MNHPYLAFASLDNGVETFYVPFRTEAEQYARSLAPSIYRASREYMRANYSADDLVVLVPFADMPTADMAQDLHGGRIMGYPMKLVDGIDEPMLAVALKRTDLP